MKFENIQKLKDLINTSNNIVIIPHTNPDGDALGSCLALKGIFNKLNKNSFVISPNKAPDFYNWIPYFKEIKYFEDKPNECSEIIKDCDLIFTLDFNDLSRIGELSTSVNQSNAEIIMIDHHQNPKNYAELTFSFPEIGSTCELLYEIIVSLGFDELINNNISTCIYLGMLTDTGSFQYKSVSGRTHFIVSKLFEKNINHNEIYNKVYNDSSKSRLDVLGLALNSLTHLKVFNTVYMFLKRDDLDNIGYQKGDTEGIVNYGLSLKGVVFCAIFIEDVNSKNSVKISFRSIGDFACNKFAENNFNGGGHSNAAGGKFEGTSNEAIKKFIKLLPNYKNNLK